MVVIDYLTRLITLPRRLLAERRAALQARRPEPPLPPTHWEDEMLYMLPPFY
jgi:hypothetical protein